jgi:hypothetical protein
MARPSTDRLRSAARSICWRSRKVNCSFAVGLVSTTRTDHTEQGQATQEGCSNAPARLFPRLSKASVPRVARRLSRHTCPRDRSRALPGLTSEVLFKQRNHYVQVFSAQPLHDVFAGFKQLRRDTRLSRVDRSLCGAPAHCRSDEAAEEGGGDEVDEFWTVERAARSPVLERRRTGRSCKRTSWE